MSNEMIERVIKASFDCWNKNKGLNYTVDDLSSSEREFAELHAKEIIRAIREPSEEMLIAGSKVDTETLEYDTWQAMIDEILRN